MIYTLTLNPALDYVVSLDSLTPGGLNRLRQTQIVWGGKGINVSTMLHRLGVKSIALGFAAGFTGQALIQGLEADGLQCRFIVLPEGLTRINVKIKAEQETELNAPGPDVPQNALDALYAYFDELTNTDTLILSGSVPPSVPSDIYEQILSRLQGRGIRFIVDAAGDLLRRTLTYRPFLIKPNHHELSELTGHPLQTETELLEAARTLQRQGARNVLISRAEHGALLLTEDGAVYRQDAFSGTVINSVGAGDAMVAGFLAGLENGYAAALRLGAACGSATAFSTGLAEKEAVDKLLTQSAPG